MNFAELGSQRKKREAERRRGDEEWIEAHAEIASMFTTVDWMKPKQRERGNLEQHHHPEEEEKKEGNERARERLS